MAFISQRSGQSFFSQRSEYLFCAVSGIINDYFDDETPSTKEYRQLRNFLRTRLPHIQESDKFLTKLPELFSDKEKHLEKYIPWLEKIWNLPEKLLVGLVIQEIIRSPGN